MKKRNIILIIVAVTLILTACFMCFYTIFGTHWYGKELPSYFYSDGNNWSKLNSKEREFIRKFKSSPKLKIINIELENEPWEGHNRFTDEGTYFNCDESECEVDLYYYDGTYLHFLPLQTLGGERIKKQTESKCKVIEDTRDYLTISDDGYRYTFYSWEYYNKNFID